MTAVSRYLNQLRAGAEAAAVTETAWRKEAAARTELLERTRAESFRRWNVLRAMSGAMLGIEDHEQAIAAGLGNIRERLGWHSVADESQQAVLTELRPVAAVMLELEGDVDAAVRDFEAWFLARTGRGFWTLLDQPAVDTPVVDF